MTHVDPITATTPAYERLSELGHCDGPGGAEHERVAQEWDEAGRPADIEAFVRHHANVLPAEIALPIIVDGAATACCFARMLSDWLRTRADEPAARLAKELEGKLDTLCTQLRSLKGSENEATPGGAVRGSEARHGHTPSQQQHHSTGNRQHIAKSREHER